jgi:hypothetical protein
MCGFTAALLLSPQLGFTLGCLGLLLVFATSIHWLILRATQNTQQERDKPMNKTHHAVKNKQPLLAVSFAMSVWAVLTGYCGTMLP